MTNKFGIRSTVVAVLLGALGASGVAFAQTTEVEPNNTINTTQDLTPYIDSTGTVQVTGNIGACSSCSINDVDFYSFQGKAGDVVTFDIDGTSGLDAFLAVFAPDGTWQVNDDMGNPTDSGSTSPLDPYLVWTTLPKDGTYKVGVSGYGVSFMQDGTVYSFDALNSSSSGSYTLIISGVTPPAPTPAPAPAPAPQPPAVQQISIDIIPGVRSLAIPNPKAKGTIPVALLSSADFDAMQVDQSSLTFGETGDEKSLRRCNKEGTDVNHDRRPDLICHFDRVEAGLQPGDLTAIVKGRTMSGDLFEGTGPLKVVPIFKRHFDRDEHHDRGRHGDRDAD